MIQIVQILEMSIDNFLQKEYNTIKHYISLKFHFIKKMLINFLCYLSNKLFINKILTKTVIMEKLTLGTSEPFRSTHNYRHFCSIRYLLSLFDVLHVH